MKQIEVVALNRDILQTHVLEARQNLAALRVNGGETIWVTSGSDDHNDEIYTKLFRGASEPQLSMNTPVEIATLGLLTASLDPKIVLYYPAITAAIMSDRYSAEQAYRYNPPFHEFTRNLIARMMSSGMQINVL